MFKRECAFYLSHSLVALTMGVITYCIFRPDTYVSQVVYEFLDMESSCFDIERVFPKCFILFCRNFFADMLWAYALTFAMSAVWFDGEYSLMRMLVLCIGFEMVVEFMQLIDFMHGTFDWLDIGVEFCATALAALIIKRKGEKKV